MEVEERTQKLVPAMGMSEPLGVEDGAARFMKSLTELRELRSQLRHAADHCESTFRNATKKKIMVENTKGYILKTIVTVVDHLGNVAANLECSLHETSKVSETEQRIDCLRQRVLTSLHYSVTIDLSTLRSNVRFPRHLPHYIAPGKGTHVDETSIGVMRDEDDAIESTASEAPSRHEELAIHKLVADYADAKISYDHLSLGTELSKVLPVLEGLSILSNPSKPCFGSQAECGRILGNVGQKKKQVLSTYLSSLLRRSKKGP